MTAKPNHPCHFHQGHPDLLPLVERLAAEKPIAHGLLIEYPVSPELLADTWPGDWHVMSLVQLTALQFSERYDLAIVALQASHYDPNLHASKAPLHNNQLTRHQATSSRHSESSQHHHGPYSQTQLLAPAITRLRDLLARRVLVLASPDFTGLLRSLGFSQIEQLNAQFIIWQFNILSYKQVPDWLNSKYWANPENWGKYRW